MFGKKARMNEETPPQSPPAGDSATQSTSQQMTREALKGAGRGAGGVAGRMIALGVAASVFDIPTGAGIVVEAVSTARRLVGAFRD